FPMLRIPKALEDQGTVTGRLHALIWTTTPWTLPANRAIAVNPDLDYVVVDAGKEQDLVKVLGSSELSTEIIAHINGAVLGGASYRNVLRGAESELQPILVADFV